MKKIFLFAISVMSLIACSSGSEAIQEEQQETQQSKMVEVGVKLTGEINITSTTLSKASSGTPVYGVQIYEHGNRDKHYAYGIFSDLSKLRVKMSTTKTYDIEILYLPQGSIIYHSGDVWQLPFNTFDWSGTTMDNLYYSVANYIHSLGNGMNCLTDERTHASFNEIDQYYGYLQDYVPEEGKTINVDMKREVFGLTFKSNKIEGYSFNNLVIKVNAKAALGDNPHKYTMTIDNTKQINELVIPIISMKFFQNVETTNDVDISIGTTENESSIYSGTITVAHNMMYTLSFDLKTSEVTNGSMAINLENSAMGSSEQKLN